MGNYELQQPNPGKMTKGTGLPEWRQWVILSRKEPRPEEVLAEGGENPERVAEEGYKYQNTS